MTSARAQAPAALHETHISVLLLVGDRAYKLKKPVRLDFVDLSTREARERICHREVALNRRLAPDVYLGVADIVGPDGNVCDHLVVMRRMPDDRRLSTLVLSGVDITDELREVARTVVGFHAGAVTSHGIAEAGRADVVRERWEATFATIEPFVGAMVAPEAEARVRHLARRYLDGRSALFSQRIADHKVRDGHGDLLADDIFCLDDGPRILDCVEFDDTLRYGDVLADACFLAMDLERLGAPDLGAKFLAWYREFAGETYPPTLADHYLAFRAHIRSMVACLRASQGDKAAAQEGAQHLDIARRHLECGQVALVLVGGLPGTGKSTLAGRLADRFGWNVLRSDEVRKDLGGIGHTQRAEARFREGLYSTEATAATYRELLSRAGRLLERGEPVVLDASWMGQQHRDAAAELARRTSSELVELECVAPAELAAKRLHDRALGGVDASDATPAIATAMAQRADRWSSAHAVDTASSEDATFADAESFVQRQLGLHK